MNITKPKNICHWPKTAKYTILLMTIAALGLVAFGVYTGQPVFFLKWFFGLQPDD